MGESKYTLWSRIEATLRKPEIPTIRRLLGESMIERNDSLWREVEALEEVLQAAQEQNQELRDRSRPAGLTQGPQREYMEQNIRLLLRKLQLDELSLSPRPASDGRVEKASSKGWDSKPIVETPREKLVYDYIVNSECHPSSAPGSGGGGNVWSRPSSRGSTARSSCSAPDVLISTGESLTVDSTESVLSSLRAAFEDEAKNLMADIQELTEQLELETDQKVASEIVVKGGAMNTADLASFGKKLEQRVRQKDEQGATLSRLRDLPARLGSPSTLAPVPTTRPPFPRKLTASPDKSVRGRTPIKPLGKVPSKSNTEDISIFENAAVEEELAVGSPGARERAPVRLRGAVQQSRDEKHFTDDDKYF